MDPRNRKIRGWWKEKDDVEAKRKRREQRRQDKLGDTFEDTADGHLNKKRKIKAGSNRFYTVSKQSWNQLVALTDNDNEKVQDTTEFSFSNKIDKEKTKQTSAGDSESDSESSSDESSSENETQFGQKSFKFGNEWKLPQSKLKSKSKSSKHGKKEIGMDSDDEFDDNQDVDDVDDSTDPFGENNGVMIDEMGNLIDVDVDGDDNVDKIGQIGQIGQIDRSQKISDKDLRKDIDITTTDTKENEILCKDENIGKEKPYYLRKHDGKSLAQELFDKNGNWQLEMDIDFLSNVKIKKNIQNSQNNKHQNKNKNKSKNKNKNKLDFGNKEIKCNFMRSERSKEQVGLNFNKDGIYFERAIRSHDRWLQRKLKNEQMKKLTMKYNNKNSNNRNDKEYTYNDNDDDDDDDEDMGNVKERLAQGGWNENKFEHREKYYDYKNNYPKNNKYNRRNYNKGNNYHNYNNQRFNNRNRNRNGNGNSNTGAGDNLNRRNNHHQYKQRQSQNSAKNNKRQGGFNKSNNNRNRNNNYDAKTQNTNGIPPKKRRKVEK